jgi:hypothetical protein
MWLKAASCNSIQPSCPSNCAGEAKLAVKGDLLGSRQDAVMKLDDFPMAMLQPIFRAVPALQHAAPAVAAPGSSPPAAELLNRMNIRFLKCAA